MKHCHEPSCEHVFVAQERIRGLEAEVERACVLLSQNDPEGESPEEWREYLTGGGRESGADDGVKERRAEEMPPDPAVQRGEGKLSRHGRAGSTPSGGSGSRPDSAAANPAAREECSECGHDHHRYTDGIGAYCVAAVSPGNVCWCAARKEASP